MNLKKIIATFYVAYTTYIFMLICSTNLTLLQMLPAILMMWINYFFFSQGFRIPAKPFVTRKPRSCLIHAPGKARRFFLAVIAGISMLFSIVAVYFYTGQTPISVFGNIKGNVSLYYAYQEYFVEHQRAVFSFRKIPFILMIYFVKLISFYSFCFLIAKRRKLCFVEKIYLVVVTLSFIYIGVARGTSFEFFELTLLVLFVLFSKYEGRRLPVKRLVIAGILGIGMIYVFSVGLSARGYVYRPPIFGDVIYDAGGVLPQNAPSLAYITLILYGYFGFGFFYTTTFITEVWLTSLINFISGLVPFGFAASAGRPLRDVMSNIVSIGAKWHPDVVLAINNFGYVGLLFICFVLGSIAKRNKISGADNGPLVYLSDFIILLQMLSLPVGNFVFVSSANQLIFLTLIFYWIKQEFFKMRNRHIRYGL